MLEDKVLIWWFNHGRPEVLHQIYDKYKADLLTLATALLRDPAVAEDRGSRCVHIVAQDVRQVQAYRQPERLFSDLRRQRCSRHQRGRVNGMQALTWIRLARLSHTATSRIVQPLSMNRSVG